MKEYKLFHESAHSLIYQVFEPQGTQPEKIIKLARPTGNYEQRIIFLQREFVYTQLVHDIPGVRKVLEETFYENQYALALEFLQGLSLKSFAHLHNPAWKKIVGYCLQLCDVLGAIHGLQIVHKDLNTHNILIQEDAQGNQVPYIIDFALAAHLNETEFYQEHPELWLEEIELMGTWAYMSPEQSGRTNYPVDVRTDLYSLGVVMYEVLTNRLPFQAKDPIDWIYAHLTSTPTPPHQVEGKVPKELSDIVLKLLAKKPDQRYASVWALKNDLERLLQRSEPTSGLTSSPILASIPPEASNLNEDIPLIGRISELSALQRIYDRSQNGSVNFVFLEGMPGTGTSSLALELKPYVQERGGIFLMGKFDVLKAASPYHAWIEIINSFIQYLLTESASRLEKWKEVILEAIAPYGNLMTAVFPKLELIVGTLPEPEAAGGLEYQYRFNQVVQRFIDAISTKELPLCLFMDDWHESDAASVELLELLLTHPQQDYFMLIGTYHPLKELDRHPFGFFLEKKRETLETIRLVNFSLEETRDYLASAFGKQDETYEALFQTLHNKTGGNPWFLNKLLQTLVELRLIYKSPDTLQWKYDLKAIGRLTLSDNLGEEIAAGVKQLPETLQALVAKAACIGDTFELDLLILLTGTHADTIRQELSLLENANLLVFDGDIYKFNHPRIRRAAYELLSPVEKPYIHLKIGNHLLYTLNKAQRDDRIYEIAEHLIQGKEIIQKDIRLSSVKLGREEFTEITLQAAAHAKASAAFKAAYRYLSAAGELFDQKDWVNTYERSYLLHKEWAELSYICGEVPTFRKILKGGLKQVVRAIHKAELLNLELNYRFGRGEYLQAFILGKEALRILGFSLADDADPYFIRRRYHHIYQLYTGVPLVLLENRPVIRQENILFALKLLTNIRYAAQQSLNQEVWALVSLKATYLTLVYGNAEDTPQVLAAFARQLIQIDEKYQEAIELGEFALDWAVRKLPSVQIAKVSLIVGSHLLHWSKPLKYTAAVLDLGYQKGLEGGDMTAASLCLIRKAINAFSQGLNLEAVQTIVDQAISPALSTGQIIPLHILYIYQTYLALLADNQAFPVEYSDEAQLEKAVRLTEQDQVFCFYHLFKLQYYFLKGDYLEAWKNVEAIAPYGRFINGTYQEADLAFYSILIYCSLSQDKFETAKVAEDIDKLRRFKQIYPANFEHKYMLAQAEIEKKSGLFWQAQQCYDVAIRSARRNNYVQDEALANELAGDFWLEQGKHELSRVYLSHAQQLYKRWGTQNKSHSLEEEYPQFFFNQELKAGDATGAGTSLDNLTLMKASQTLSGEIVLSNLLEKFMQIMLVHAGAVKGAFLTLRNGKLWVRAVIDSNKKVKVLDQISAEEYPELPQSMVNYVSRTRQELILEEAYTDELYGLDPYIRQYIIRSAACFPVSRNNRLIAIIYLENNLTEGAFSSERVEVLHVLAAQAAISLENAWLYENLEEKVAERTQELYEKNQELSEAMQKLNETQTQLINSAKLASLGQLTAGVAHEVNNPLNFISSNIAPLKRNLQDISALFLGIKAMEMASDIQASALEVIDHSKEIDATYLFEEIDLLLKGIEEGAARTKKIVDGLTTFSQIGMDAFSTMDINEGLDAMLMLMKKHFRDKIQLQLEMGVLPKIECIPGKINQVFMNIVQNAIQAVEKKIETGYATSGMVTIRTLHTDQQVEVHIIDDGIGMKAETLTRIFEPFFTTREVGSGVGLGLSTAYAIIEQHGGNIEVKSLYGQGSEFIVTLPVSR